MNAKSANLCQHCDHWKYMVCWNAESPNCTKITGRIDGCLQAEPQKPLPVEITGKGISQCPRCCAVVENTDTTKPGGHIVCHKCGATLITPKQ